MKRLLIFHNTIAPYRIDFFNDLYSKFECKICLEYENLQDQKFDYQKIKDQFVFRPNYLNTLFAIRGKSVYSGLWEQIDKFHPDIVLTNEFNQITIAVLLHRFLKRGKYKVISVCDDSYDMVVNDNDFSKVHKIARKLIVPLLDNLILLDSGATQWYEQKYKKGFFFPLIKDEQKARKIYENITDKSNEIVEQLSLKNKKVTLFVGRCVALKNVNILIEAFARLNQKENVLIIIGDGNKKEEWKILADRLHVNTVFAGRLEGNELYAYYNIANVFVLPSYLEPFGAVTNEALLAGCDCLVSNKAGSRVLIKIGYNGDIFNPMDANECFEKLKKLLDDQMPIENIFLRKNKMIYFYEDFINKLVDFLNNI